MAWLESERARARGREARLKIQLYTSQGGNTAAMSLLLLSTTPRGASLQIGRFIGRLFLLASASLYQFSKTGTSQVVGLWRHLRNSRKYHIKCGDGKGKRRGTDVSA